MVVAPRMDQDVQVDLPGIYNPDPEVETSLDPLKVSVATAGEYYINDQRYDLDGAIDLLSAEHAAEPLRRLVLRADAKLTYGQVREIFARSQQVGFPGVALMVGERNRPGIEHTRNATDEPHEPADSTESHAKQADGVADGEG
jgi:biopolymer transport protein ExbD